MAYCTVALKPVSILTEVLVALLVLCCAGAPSPCSASVSTESAAHTALQQLGRSLFFDSSLSRDGTISCASCHKPDQAFSDGRRVAVGVGQQTGTRNTPSLLSLSGAPFFWDGRAATLDAVVLQPFTNPVEMGLTDPGELLNRLQRSQRYQAAFRQAFPRGASAPSLDRSAQALTAFVDSLPHGASPYDRYAAGDTTALSAAARHGLTLFAGPAHCGECHRIDGRKASFSDRDFHSTVTNPKLVGRLPSAATALAASPINGPPLSARIESDPLTSELGRYAVTLNPRDIGAFRTPSLRNVALTAPYMHDGSVATLRKAVDREIYYRSLQNNRPSTLTEQDRQDLVALLQSLSDAPSGAPIVRAAQ